MRHFIAISKQAPAKAQDDIPPSAKLEFLIAILAAVTPLLTAKEANG